MNRRIKEATRRELPILLHGVIMGGGPSQWAAEDHVRKGLPVFATPEAARSFNDDLEAVREMGIQVIGDDEAAALAGDIFRIELRDFDFPAIRRAFESFGVSLDDLSAVAVAVFDHGNAPPDVSDRQFRFDYLDERLRVHAGEGTRRQLSAFAYEAGEVPGIMTRLQAVVDSAKDVDAPLVVMDTAPAAVLGATYDPVLAARDQLIIANVGNFHTLAFRLGSEGIEGVFEHHTGLIDLVKLENLLYGLAKSSLVHQDVFGDHGHGALVYNPEPLSFVDGKLDAAVTGPRRGMMYAAQSVKPYFAVPFGDMMIAGCFGLLSAVGDLLPDLRDEIHRSMEENRSSMAPWDAV
ncbi:MAG: pyruvate formate lyase-activating protein [Chloroflexi bacterium]|nr:MAG: pyruvate formate lyase-activating protein [Chloroflexota bacterium]